MKSARKLLFATCSLAVRRLAWLGAAVTLLIGATPALPSAAGTAMDQPPSALKSIPDRVAAVRERIAKDGKSAARPVFYRLSQFFNFPNFPNFNNFPNFPNFQNFPNFPNFPKF
jgi:hypothetical protein